MIIDLRQMAFATLWKKYEKKINTEEVKQAIRENREDVGYKFADYAKVRLKPYTSSKYSKEDQAKIDKFIEENHIEKITETKEDYSIEFVPSEKAINEFNKMLNDLEQSKHRNIAKVASIAKGKIK